MSYSESSLLLVNGAAGAGRAVDEARKITRKTGIESVSIQDLSQLSWQEVEQLMLPLTNLFVLGGDGSTFSLLNVLFQLQQQNADFTNKTVVPLGLGGENVVAKHLKTFSRNKLKVVTSVLEGRYEKEHLEYGVIRTPAGKEELFFWNAHAGFSSSVLEKIEEQRAAGVGDVQRRYKGVQQAFRSIDASSQVIYTLNGIEREPVLDFGVIAAQLPYWTSKIHVDVSVLSPAVLHTIATLESSGRNNYTYTSRLILDVLSLTFGLPLQTSILKHIPLLEGDVLEVISSPTQLTVDSEGITSSSGVITVPRQRKSSGIYVANMRKD